MLTPVFIVIAIWIKLDSKGPVFFRQIRVGRNEKNFEIFKFRTMFKRIDKDKQQLTLKNDPRISRAGHFLRKYKFDELPQFINVLLGHMSIVGPRPEVPYFVEKYPDNLRQKIFSMRPGITDNASIEFRDESKLLDDSNNPEKKYIEEILPVKLKYYSEYIDHNTLFNDIAIILRTVYSIKYL